ncbi:coniferyl alcohol acyltransferase-like [Vicia villosa]|uniref:coniferyl alcohol acyltransferase-like n=1 Tax=Vicia villosa TaxID=3911 RepID=UPI00273B0CCC|nr:coniferyl alcohol acyltransferase-like [Vicia villosa]
MGIENGNFTVSITNEEVVAAALPFHEHSLPLSNLDLLLPKVDVGVFFCYKNPMLSSTSITLITFESMVVSLKKALAKVLVSYYVFAGEVVSNSLGEPELLCNNRGVDFVEAVADIELKCLNFYNPDESVEGKLVPKKKHGVFVIQATSLKCGGIVVACTFDHRIADAYSTNMFLVSWAEMAHPTKPMKPTTITTTNKPCFRRSLLSPRGYPTSIHHSINDMYIPISKLPPPSSTTTKPLLSRIYYVTGENLYRLQKLAGATCNGSNYNTKPTKLESFSAYLWKLIAHAAIKEDSKMAIAKMGIVVDGRKRLENYSIGEEMTNYFGNVLSIPFGAKPIEELVDKPLGWVVDDVREFVSIATTEEHFLGLIDWVEMNRPIPGLAKIYCGGSKEGPAFVVSSGQRFPEEKMNFGWGEVVFGSYHFPWCGEAGYVMPMPSPLRNGDWIVYMHLLKQHLEIIESKAGHVFVPLTWDYLKQG